MKQSSLLAAFKLQKGMLATSSSAEGDITFYLQHGQLSEHDNAAPKKRTEVTPVATADSGADKAAVEKRSAARLEEDAPANCVSSKAHAASTPQETKVQPQVGQCLRVYWPDDDDWCDSMLAVQVPCHKHQEACKHW